MCDEKLLYFETTVQTYTRVQKINIPRLCNAVTVKNTGNIICVFDLDPLQPGESKSIGGNRGEVTIGRHDVDFTTQGMTVVPPVQNPSCVVTLKYYIKPPSGMQIELP